MWRRVISLVNARVHTGHGLAGSVRFAAAVLGIDERPRRGDVVVDLDGAVVLPGLVNAHDHLELNHYGRMKFRERYDNVSHWIDDMRPRLQQDARIRAGRSAPLADRLFAGILKNLLSGVTRVAHHNPFYRELGRAQPIRVLRRYGWAHSFDLQHAPAGARGEKGGDVAERHHATPGDLPFFVHLSEGVDERAAGEFSRLASLACITENLVAVHGVAMTPEDWRAAAARGAGLVWCPGSNEFLFGRTAPVRAFLDQPACGCRPRIALGTDSRLSGEHDLLDEARRAVRIGAVSPAEVLGMMTTAGADLLRVPGGRLEPGRPADITVVPAKDNDPAASLLAASRADVRLVVVGGQPRVGAPDLARVFEARRVRTRMLMVDGHRRLADAEIAARAIRCAVRETGVGAA